MVAGPEPPLAGCRKLPDKRTKEMCLPGCLELSIVAEQQTADGAPPPAARRPPPSPLAAAERRLALCALRHERLARDAALGGFARSEPGRKLVEMVGRQVVAYDYEGARAKLRRFGPVAAAARAQFVPPTPCSPWRSSAGCVPAECAARCHADMHCPSCQRVGLDAAREEQPQAVAFLLQGHPQPAFDGVYRAVSERNGFPVLRNTRGMHCLRSETTHAWFLSDQLDPATDEMTAMLAMSADEGPIPTDDFSHETGWLCVDTRDQSWTGRSFRFDLLMTEADVAAALARLQEAKEEKVKAELAALESCLVVAGCPPALAQCNGHYVPCEDPVPLCGGWAHYRNSASGCRLYFYEKLGRWFINAAFTPNLDAAHMWIDPTHVPFAPARRLPVDLPLGVRTWQCDEGAFGQPQWMARTVNVRMLQVDTMLSSVMANQRLEDSVSLATASSR
jgi:hypothetical protein